MTVSPVTEGDLPQCLHFMEGHTRDAMFPLGNLQDFGLACPENTAPRAMSFFAFRQGGAIIAVLGQSREGALFPIFGDTPPDLYAAFLPFIGKTVSGVMGPQSQVRPLLDLLGVDKDRKLDTDEPQLDLDLADLSLPQEGEISLTPITPDLFEQALDWRAQYDVTLLNTPPDQARIGARHNIARYIERDSHRMLLRGGTPVAMTGFNARYDGHVQIGGVFTPPALRGHGYAGIAILLHLAEARLEGAAHATLFAASDSAARVYRRIGFADCGRYSLVLFSPQEGRA